MSSPYKKKFHGNYHVIIDYHEKSKNFYGNQWSPFEPCKKVFFSKLVSHVIFLVLKYFLKSICCFMMKLFSFIAGDGLWNQLDYIYTSVLLHFFSCKINCVLYCKMIFLFLEIDQVTENSNWATFSSCSIFVTNHA